MLTFVKLVGEYIPADAFPIDPRTNERMKMQDPHHMPPETILCLVNHISASYAGTVPAASAFRWVPRPASSKIKEDILAASSVPESEDGVEAPAPAAADPPSGVTESEDEAEDPAPTAAKAGSSRAAGKGKAPASPSPSLDAMEGTEGDSINAPKPTSNPREWQTMDDFDNRDVALAAGLDYNPASGSGDTGIPLHEQTVQLLAAEVAASSETPGSTALTPPAPLHSTDDSIPPPSGVLAGPSSTAAAVPGVTNSIRSFGVPPKPLTPEMSEVSSALPY